jgi:hypothetical protein
MTSSQWAIFDLTVDKLVLHEAGWKTLSGSIKARRCARNFGLERVEDGSPPNGSLSALLKNVETMVR